MKFKVDYLGALLLQEKATSLDVLQEPLKDLYYKYRTVISRGHQPLPGSLQITERGLLIAHGNEESMSHYEFTNPFPTIAVWAAVKLVIRREPVDPTRTESGSERAKHSYAFLPLICDPEAGSKDNMFLPLNVGDPSVMAVSQHPPMFACVMRKMGVPKILECHGFVCRSSEDAIVIAANLYQALLQNMRNEEASEENINLMEDQDILSDSEALPTKPPRKRRSSSRPRSEYSESVCFSDIIRRSSSEDHLQFSQSDLLRCSRKSSLKRSYSDRNPNAFKRENGDMFTKVAIPRSKSSMNIRNKYNIHDLMNDVKEKTGLKSVDQVLKQIIKPKGMSFSEMDPTHREILLKLALTLTKDEIYQRSKNILRKKRGRRNSVISLTDSDTSQSSTFSSVIKATKRSFSKLGSKASSLQNSYLKDKSSLRKILQNRNRDGSQEWYGGKENELSLLLDEIGRKNELKYLLDISKKKSNKNTSVSKRSVSRSEGYITCSECGYESECSNKCYCSLPRGNNSIKLSLKSLTLPPLNKLEQTSDDQNHDCESESCAESEKCYCSLQRVNKSGLKIYEINLDSETDANTDVTVKSVGSYKKGFGSQSNLSDATSKHGSSWKINTEGSVSSAARHLSSSPYLTEQSKSRSQGTVFSVQAEVRRKKSISSILSVESDIPKARRSSGVSGYHSRESRSRQGLRRRAASTESLLTPPRIKRHPSGSLGSAGSHGSDDSRPSSNEGIILEKGSQRSKSSRGSKDSKGQMMLLSAVDPTGKVVYRGASQQKQKKEGSDTTSILSMKKTAEIAALFSELKLNQTTDMINIITMETESEESDDDDNDDTLASIQANNSFLFSDKIENSLGYLP